MKTHLNTKILVAVLALAAPAVAFAQPATATPNRPITTAHLTQAIHPRLHTEAVDTMTPTLQFNLIDGQPIR